MYHNLAVVICHGFYHTPALYQPLVDLLQSSDIETYCPQLPTSDLTKLNVGDTAHPVFDLDPPVGGYPQGKEDSEVVYQVLKNLIDQGKEVLLLAHSAGGWVATETAVPEFQAKVRKEQRLPGGIVGIFYFGAFVIPVGESIHSFFQPKTGPAVTPPWLKVHKHGYDGLATLNSPETFLFEGLEPDEATRCAAMLTASPIVKTVLQNDAYSALPCAYLVLENDQMLPKVYQEGMIAAQGQKTGAFKVYSCPSGHSPHLTWTQGMAGTVKDFIGQIRS